jgi:DNA-binding beta-propeller fold protein YncE
MRILAIAVLACLIAVTPAAADNESACSEAVTRSFAGLRNAHVKAQNACVNNPSYFCSNHRVNVKEDLLQLSITGPSSPCLAAVISDGVPVSAFGPGATCPGAFGYDGGGDPITDLEELAFCLEGVAAGHANKSRHTLGLLSGVVLSEADKNEHKCASYAFKSLVKAWKTGIKDVARCARGGTKPFACSIDASPDSNFGRALTRIDRDVAKCTDANGVAAALSGESEKLCLRHLSGIDDLAACVREAAMCLVCRDANALYELGEDCAAFANSRTCYGRQPEMGEDAAFVTNAGDDTVTRYAPGFTYAGGSLAASSVTVGANPVAVAVHADSNTLFTANRDDDTVTLIAASTGAYANGSALASTIPVGDEPVDLEVNPDYDILYVVNQADGTVTFLDVQDGEPAFGDFASSTFGVGASPIAIRYVPGNVSDDIPYTLVVANAGDDSITLLDPATGAYVFGTLAASTFPTVTAPTSISARGAPIAVGSAVDEAIAYHDPRTGLPWFGTLGESTVPVGMPVTAIARRTSIEPITEEFDLSGFNLLSAADDLLLSVSHHERRAEGPIATGAVPVAADTADAGFSLYVVEQGIDRVAAYTPGDSAALSVIPVPFGSVPNEAATDRIAVNTASDTIYVATCDDVRYIDAGAAQYKFGSEAASTFAIPTCSQNVAVSPALNRVYVASKGSDVVTYLDATTGAYVGGSLAAASIAVGSDPGAMVVNEADGILYVANTSAGGIPLSVTYLDAGTPAYVGADLASSSIEIPTTTEALDVNPSNATLYVAGYDYPVGSGGVMYLDASTPAYKFGTAAASLINVGGSAYAVAVNASTDTLFVSSASGMAYLDATTGAAVPGAAIGGGLQFAVDAAAGVLYVSDYFGISLMHFDTTAGYITGRYETSHMGTGAAHDMEIHPGLGLIYSTNASFYAYSPHIFFWNAHRMSLAFPDVAVTQTIATGPMPNDIEIVTVP